MERNTDDDIMAGRLLALKVHDFIGKIEELPPAPTVIMLAMCSVLAVYCKMMNDPTIYEMIGSVVEECAADLTISEEMVGALTN